MKKLIKSLLLCSIAFSSFAQPNFGVLINSNGAFGTPDKAVMAQQLGVPLVRENIVLNAFNGVEKSFDTYSSYGFDFMCNLNWMAGVNTMPNLAAYSAALESVANSKYGHCPVYFLQNEELNPTFNKFSADQYVQMLQVASGIMHAHGLKIANGGIYGVPLFQLCYKFMVDTYGQSAADLFAANAKLTTSQKKQATGTPSSKMIATQTVINGVKQYCDYINVHFYLDAKGITSDQVWPAVKSYLEMVTGKPCITNETCLRNSSDPNLVTAMVNTYKLSNTFYVGWFSGEGSGPAMAGGVSLFNPDKTIRPNGIAFSNAIK